jgi:hypothetical protein
MNPWIRRPRTEDFVETARILAVTSHTEPLLRRSCKRDMLRWQLLVARGVFDDVF